MKLSPVWFIENLDGHRIIDKEFQRYRMLDFLQQVDKDYSESKIYPAFSECRFHMKNCEAYLATRCVITKDMGLTDEQRELAESLYDLEDGEAMETTMDIMEWALPKLKKRSDALGIMWKKVDSCINTFYLNVGVDMENGAVFVRHAGSHIVEVFTLSPHGMDPVKLVDMKQHQYKEIMEDLGYVGQTVICAESTLSYPTKESIIPILEYNIIGAMRGGWK